jgi:hypothetical protein
MALCTHKFKSSIREECPHVALEGKDVCYWHEKRKGKNPFKELGNRSFKNSNLSEAYLSKANLDEADLQGAFLDGANLQGASMGEANLSEANLFMANIQGAFLDGANLQGADLFRANLSEANLSMANLQGAFLDGANLQGARLQIANCSYASFRDANLASTNLYLAVFDKSYLWQARNIDDIVGNEKSGDRRKDMDIKLEFYRQSSQIYRNLKNYFRDEGIYEKSGNYYYREKIIEKKIYRHIDIWKYLGSFLLDSLCGYGEKPWRITISSIVWIFFCSFIYFILGIEGGATEIAFSSQSCLIQNLHNFWYCIYFSFVTFTTLGYGDFHPVGTTMLFSIIEAFTGAFMIALFVFTMGRKIIR